MANITTLKDENLDPIKSCSIPQSTTQLKAFLGATHQSCNTTAQADQKGSAPPNQKQMDSRIQL